MLTSRFLFMFLYSIQNYKPIRFCTCSCPKGERRYTKIYLKKDILKRIIAKQILEVRCSEEKKTKTKKLVNQN